MQVYDEFCPILLNQFKSREYMKFETFNAAVDEFYSKIESQRAEQQQKAKEGSAVQKLNKIRLDQVLYLCLLCKKGTCVPNSLTDLRYIFSPSILACEPF